jgi:hypothetical protein
MRKNAFSAEMEVRVIFYLSISIETRDSNINQFVPHDMNCNSYHYKFLLNSIPLGLIKLQTYLSIWGKKLFLTFKNQCEGESIETVVSTLCCCLHGEYNHIVGMWFLVSFQTSSNIETVVIFPIPNTDSFEVQVIGLKPLYSVLPRNWAVY